MKVASFTSADVASYGIVADKGIINAGKRLKAFPILRALLAKGSLDFKASSLIMGCRT